MESKRIAFYVVILAVAAGGYFYFSQPPMDGPGRPSAADIDSIAAPERPTITARTDTTDTMPTPVAENLSPGTALLKATILSVESVEGQPVTITIRVDEVLGYGSATPPLPTGIELGLRVKGYLEANPKFRDHVEQEGQVQLVVASQQGMAVKKSENRQQWSLVAFKE